MKVFLHEYRCAVDGEMKEDGLSIFKSHVILGRIFEIVQTDVEVVFNVKT